MFHSATKVAETDVAINPSECRIYTLGVWPNAPKFVMTKTTAAMETCRLPNDIRVFCITARSFPYGIAGAFAALEKLLSARCNRVFFGLSRKNANGIITYQAAASEAYRGETPKPGCNTFVIPRGEYLAKTIPAWRTRENSVAQAFALLMADSRVDARFPMLEWYEDCDTVTCMVRIDPAKKERPVTEPLPSINHSKMSELC